MRGGICPTCESAEVYTDEQFNTTRNAGNAIRIGSWSQAYLNYYVCTNCGYVESYITDADSLIEIAEKWKRVLPI